MSGLDCEHNPNRDFLLSMATKSRIKQYNDHYIPTGIKAHIIDSKLNHIRRYVTYNENEGQYIVTDNNYYNLIRQYGVGNCDEQSHFLIHELKNTLIIISS